MMAANAPADRFMVCGTSKDTSFSCQMDCLSCGAAWMNTDGGVW